MGGVNDGSTYGEEAMNPMGARSHFTIELVENWNGTIVWWEHLVFLVGAGAAIIAFYVLIGWITKP
jgi:hypothetical protein